MIKNTLAKKVNRAGAITLTALMTLLLGAQNILAQVGTTSTTTGGTGTGTGTATATPGVPVTGAGGDSVYTLFLLGLSLLVIVAGISYFYLRRQNTQ